MAQLVCTSKYSKCRFKSNWPKRPWSTLGWPKVKVGQNNHKTTFFVFLHQTRAIEKFLLILTKFDLRLTLGGTINPNFDLSFTMGWGQLHCKDYGIQFPTTIHGPKLELKWNKAHQHASRGHNFWSGHWNFNFFSVLEIRNPNLSRDTKISSIGVREGLQVCIWSWTREEAKIANVSIRLSGWKVILLAI